MQFNPLAVVLEGREQMQIAASAVSRPLEAGVYAVWAEADAYIRVSPEDDVTGLSATTGYLIAAGAPPTFVRIAKDGLRIGATAEVSIHAVA